MSWGVRVAAGAVAGRGSLRPPRRPWALLGALALLLAACRAASPGAPPAAPAAAPSGPAGTAASDVGPPAAGGAPAAGAGGCPRPARPQPPRGPTTTTELLTADGDGLRVEAAVYPHPDYEGQPWSQWGQGLVLPDGRFLSAVGDHRGPDGNSYFYVYDPDSSTLTRFGDVLGGVEHEPGAWGYGKIHGQIVAGPCGDAYAATYWGSRRRLAYSPTYQGDLLLRLDPVEHTVTSLGTLLPHRGVPSLTGWTEGGLLYGEAVDPTARPKRGEFFVYDLGRHRVVFTDDSQPHLGLRNVMVGAGGVAYFAADGGQLWTYRPGDSRVGRHDQRLPGGWLRASTQPGPDGTVYGATREPDRLFALAPSGEVRDLGPARGYVASMALHPSGERFFYVPDAHGASWRQGTPLISVDTATGEQQVVVELNEPAERRLGLRLGGTYNVAVDPSGRRVYLGMNAGDPGAEDAFGEVVLVVVELG